MKASLFTCLFLLGYAAASPAPREPLDLFVYFKGPAKWEKDKDAFMAEMAPCGFRYLDAGKTSAVGTRRGALVCLSFPVYEARIFFGGKTIRRVELSLYNKGDAAEHPGQIEFEKFVKEVRARFGEALGRPEMDGGVTKPKPNYAIRRVRWTGQSPAVQLEWAYVEEHRVSGRFVPYGAEFIRVVMVPRTDSAARDRAALTGESLLVKAKTTGQLRKNVQRNAEGDVWIEPIPMVDQGQKGYCAAASAERILRYFGLEVDQHQIAQLADTSAKGGTTLQGMAQAIANVGKHYQLDRKDLIQIEDGKNFLKSDLLKQIAQYNTIAKKAGEPSVDWRAHALSGSVDIQGIWAEMDPQILLKSRLRRKQEYGAFLRNVKRYVDMGIPLLWSCVVGIYPETPELRQKGAFGHMRLIIGYNSRTRELIYSDSWGVGHARKRMPQDNAWAMTRGLIVVKPRL